MEMQCEKTPPGPKRHSSKRSKTLTPFSRMLNSHSVLTGPLPKSHMMLTLGTYASQLLTRTTPSPRKSSGLKSSCLQPLLLRIIGRKESISNNATSAGNSPASISLVCNTRMEEQKDALHAKNPAHQYADYVEAGNISKLNTINPAMIAFKPGNLWRKSSQKTGAALTSNVQFAQNHTSLTVRIAEVVMTQSNKQGDVNLSRTSLSSPRIHSNSGLDHPNQSSLQDTKPSHRVPTTPDTLGPEDHTHSRTSNQTLQPDPPINHHIINIPYE